MSEHSLPPGLLPGDPHDRRLLENVRPPGWVNPPGGRYHLVVLGAGTGGLVTAAIAAGLGARVALVERGLMGGDCLNTGCVPSKALLAAGRGWTAAREAAERFGGPAVAGEGSFAAAMERMRRLRAGIAPADSAARFRDELGVEVYLGEGRFVADDAVEVGGTRLAFRRAVIATGRRPAVPPVEGVEEAGYLTSESVFALTAPPGHLAVLGGGPIGCELAQAFARLGVRVTLLEAAERVLPGEDSDASALVARALERDGVRVLAGAEARRVARDGAGLRLRVARGGSEEEIAATHLLVAVGRRPNVERLGLERAGIAAGKGGIEVDARMRTANPRVYALGDVAGRLRFTHAADAQARMVVQNALFHRRLRERDLVIPWCTYTSPEVAHVGPAHGELDPAAVETITVPLEEVDRARLDGRDAGFVRVHLARGSDRIVAATLVAEHAGELVAQVAQAMTAGLGLGKVGETVFPYPTVAEALRKAADRWRRGRLTPLVRRALSTYFRMLR